MTFNAPILTMSEFTLKPRVVQWNQKRYSLRLEPVFWRSLERQAASRSIRLNQLVGRLAEEVGEGSLASRLRQYCLAQAEAQGAQTALSARQEDILGLFDQSPSPAALLAQNGSIRRLNAAFAARFEGAEARFLGKSFLRSFQVQTSMPLSRAWQGFVEGRRDPVSGRLAHIARGRVSSATIKLHPISARAPDRFNVVVWLS